MEKVNENSKPKELKRSTYKTILVDFQKINRLVLQFNRLFISAVYKNNLKHI